jgi:hypothetical protein
MTKASHPFGRRTLAMAAEVASRSGMSMRGNWQVAASKELASNADRVWASATR